MIKIRKIKTSDFDEVCNLIKKTHRVSFAPVYPQKLIEEFCNKYEPDKFALKAKEISYFIADEEAKIIGLIGLKGNQLRTFFVDPEKQGKGIGRLLYDRLEKEAIRRGVKVLSLEGSPLGEPIYRKLGFHKIKTINKERGGIKYSDAYMEKMLDY